MRGYTTDHRGLWDAVYNWVLFTFEREDKDLGSWLFINHNQ